MLGKQKKEKEDTQEGEEGEGVSAIINFNKSDKEITQMDNSKNECRNNIHKKEARKITGKFLNQKNKTNVLS